MTAAKVYDLRGQLALVTGAGRGIGEACAKTLAAVGAEVVLTARTEKQLEQVRDEIIKSGGKASVHAADICSMEAVNNLEKLGPFDILVNNAGIAGVNKMLWECTPQEWRDVIDIDLYGVFLCCRAFVPGMLKAGWGRIVNVASIAGKEGNPTASHYSAAKAGVIGLTKSLGKELADTNIRVNCITPAVIETEILKQCTQAHIDYMVSKIPMGRVGQAGEVAALIAWLSSDEVSFSTGAVFDISGGRATY